MVVSEHKQHQTAALEGFCFQEVAQWLTGQQFLISSILWYSLELHILDFDCTLNRITFMDFFPPLPPPPYSHSFILWISLSLSLSVGGNVMENVCDSICGPYECLHILSTSNVHNLAPEGLSSQLQKLYISEPSSRWISAWVTQKNDFLLQVTHFLKSYHIWCAERYYRNS